MYERSRDAERMPAGSPVTVTQSPRGVLQRLPHSRYFRRGLLVLGVALLYVITASLAPAAGTNTDKNSANVSNSVPVNAQEEGQSMDETNTTDNSTSQNSHHVSVNVNQQSSTQSSTSINSRTTSGGSASSTSDVVVNGQHIAVPQNGSVHKTISNPNGTASVDINVNNTGSGSSSSSSSLDVDVSGNSQSTSETGGL